MSDIMKFIMDKDALGRDPEGHLQDLGDWSEDDARAAAGGLGIALTGKHWDVVYALRHNYARNGGTHSAKDIQGMLFDAFATQGGKKYLYELFPGGPVTQASTIAGLPLPRGASDNSFGYTL